MSSSRELQYLEYTYRNNRPTTGLLNSIFMTTVNTAARSLVSVATTASTPELASRRWSASDHLSFASGLLTAAAEKALVPASAPSSSSTALVKYSGSADLGTMVCDGVDVPSVNSLGRALCHGFRKIDTDKWEFANEAFLRGQKHLLKNIHRRRSPQSNQACSSSTSQSQGSPTEVGEEIEKLRKERRALMEEMVELQQQNRGTARHVDTVNQRLKAAEQRQKQMLSFLAKLFQNPGFLDRLKNLKGEGEGGGGALGFEKARKKFIKHQQPPQDSPIGGEIVKYEADDWERLLMSEEETENIPLSSQGMTSSIEGTDPKGKNLINPSEEEMMNQDYLFPFPNPEGLVKQEETWSMGFDTTIPSFSNEDVWGNTMDYNVSKFGSVAETSSGGCLPDVCWEQFAAGITETGFNWPPGDDTTPMDDP